MHPLDSDISIVSMEDDSPIEGWKRMVRQRKRGKTTGKLDVYYVSPEGRKLRCGQDVARYLRSTGLNLPLNLFNFCVKNNGRKKSCALKQKKRQGCRSSEYFRNDLKQTFNVSPGNFQSQVSSEVTKKNQDVKTFYCDSQSPPVSEVVDVPHSVSSINEDNVEDSYVSGTENTLLDQKDNVKHDTPSINFGQLTNINQSEVMVMCPSDPIKLPIERKPVVITCCAIDNRRLTLEGHGKADGEIGGNGTFISNVTEVGSKKMNTSIYFEKNEKFNNDMTDKLDSNCATKIPPGLAKFYKQKYAPPKSPFNLIQENLHHDPWKLLVATIFLNKTNSRNAIPALWKFFDAFPNAQETSKAEPEKISNIIQSLGLVRKRTQFLIRFSTEYLMKMWHYPIELYGIGKYGNDSFRIFCLGEHKDVLPDDHKLNLYHNWICGRDRQKILDFSK